MKLKWFQTAFFILPPSLENPVIFALEIPVIFGLDPEIYIKFY